MAASLIKGAAMAKTIKEETRTAARAYREAGVVPRLAVVSASDDPAVESYLTGKRSAAAKVDIELDIHALGTAASQAEIEDTLAGLAADPSVHGVMLSLPLEKGQDQESALATIPQYKDVDGLTTANLGCVVASLEERAILAATPQACIALAETLVTLEGKRVALVGRGRTVGRVLGSMILNRNGTVTVCHSYTPEVARSTREADVVFVAVGAPGLIGRDHLRDGQVVIDAGINFVNGKLTGDVDFEAVADLNLDITPVPAGVGPVTSAMIFANLLRCMRFQGLEPAAGPTAGA